MQIVKEFEATIFTPSDTSDWIPDSNTLVWGGYIISIALLFITNLLEIDLAGPALFFMLLAISGGIWGWYEKERLHGKLYGKLMINEDSITINQNSYQWKDVSKFSFHILFHRNESLHTHGYRMTGGPAYSAGADSFVEFTHESEEFLIYFRLDSANHRKQVYEALIYLFLIDRINLKTTYNGLRMSYEEIQTLKKRKVEFKSSRT